MKIRFIVDTISTPTNANGNREHFATITSTLTGKALRVRDIGGPSNGLSLVRRADRSAAVHESNATLPARQFAQTVKMFPSAVYEHHVMPADILALEVE